MKRFLIPTVAALVSVMCFQGGPSQGRVPQAEQFARSDRRGVVLAHVGEMQFRTGNTGLSTCTHGLVLDEASLLHTRKTCLPGAAIILKGRAHRAGRGSLLDSRTDAAYRYLTDEKGLDPRFIFVQNDRAIVTTAVPDLLVSIDVYVAIKGLLPDRDYAIRSYVPVLLGDDGRVIHE